MISDKNIDLKIAEYYDTLVQWGCFPVRPGTIETYLGKLSKYERLLFWYTDCYLFTSAYEDAIKDNKINQVCVANIDSMRKEWMRLYGFTEYKNYFEHLYIYDLLEYGIFVSSANPDIRSILNYKFFDTNQIELPSLIIRNVYNPGNLFNLSGYSRFISIHGVFVFLDEIVLTVNKDNFDNLITKTGMLVKILLETKGTVSLDVKALVSNYVNVNKLSDFVKFMISTEFIDGFKCIEEIFSMFYTKDILSKSIAGLLVHPDADLFMLSLTSEESENDIPLPELEIAWN